MDEGLANATTIVVKIGTSSLVAEDGSLDTETLSKHVDDIAALWKQGKKVVLITSGAVTLGLKERGGDVCTAAMRGQISLMETYIELFKRYGIDVGQMLLTKKDFGNREKVARIVNNIDTAFRENTITIINENDATTDKKTTLGDNDALAAELAPILKAQVLVFLSRESQTENGKGGNGAKAKAIEKVEKHSIATPVVDGKTEHVIRQLFDGNSEVFKQALRDSAQIRKTALKKHLWTRR